MAGGAKMMIVVNESAAASYLYLMGLTIDEELPLTQHLSLYCRPRARPRRTT